MLNGYTGNEWTVCASLLWHPRCKSYQPWNLSGQICVIVVHEKFPRRLLYNAKNKENKNPDTKAKEFYRFDPYNRYCRGDRDSHGRFLLSHQSTTSRCPS